MGKKNRLLLSVIFSSILFIGSSITPIDSYELGFLLGEDYIFGLSFFEYYEDRDTSNGNYDIDEYRGGFEITFNITRLDLGSKVLDLAYYYPDGTLFTWTNFNFDMAIYTSYLLADTNNFFDIDFRWNSATDSVVLYDFDINFGGDPRFFIEPIWWDFNLGLKSVFNGSTIVDVVDVPSSETDIEITFGYFLEILSSYTINNRNSLNNALDQFTDNNTDLLLHFDLSNVIHNYVYDEDLGESIYVPIEKFKVDFELRYSDGGILDYFIHRYELAMSFEDDYTKIIDEYEVAYGGLKKLRTPLNLFSIIPALLVSVLIMKYSLKKKKEKVINEL